MKKEEVTFYNMFWLFILASIFGWLIEGVWTFLRKGVLINHSAVVIGPFNMAYGLSAIFLTTILYKLKDKPIPLLFLIGFIGGSLVEYTLSWSMERIIGFTAWNYSKYFLNINGRICLRYSIFWGILGVVWIKLCFPYVIKIIHKFNTKFNKVIVTSIIVFLVFDLLLTVAAVYRAKDCENNIPPANKFEQVLDKTFNKKYLNNMFNNRWFE